MPPSTVDPIESHVMKALDQVRTIRTHLSLKRKGRHPLSDHRLAYDKAMDELRAAVRELEAFYATAFKETPGGAPSQGGSGA